MFHILATSPCLSIAQMSKEDGSRREDARERHRQRMSQHQVQIQDAIAYCEQKNWPILAMALGYCWENEFLDVFRKYFREHAYAFKGSRAFPFAAKTTLTHYL